MIDITELNAEGRQKALFEMSPKDLKATARKLMANNRPTETAARLDTLTIMALRRSR